MLSQIETDYILSLINTYQMNGYRYYLCNTITDNDVVYDIDIYFSKEEIKAITSNVFDLTNAIHIKIDSSNRNSNGYNTSLHSRDVLVNGDLTSIVIIDEAEFIYTNAAFSENITLINPDLLFGNSVSYYNSLFLCGNIFLTGMIFLYLFVTQVLRLRK